MRILEKPGLTFDDVLLVPRKGYVNSRMSENDIDISTQLTPRSFKLSCPIISANMDTVTGPEMALAMEEMGGVGIIHRFMSPEEQREALLKLHMSKRIGCVGVTESERERIRKFADLCTCVLIDTAHGHSQMMVEQVQWIKESYPYVDIIAGNVCTGDAALALVRAGATCIKVGVGPGCFAAGTRILMASGFYKNIENVQSGDRIINMHGQAVSVGLAWMTGKRKVINVRHTQNAIGTRCTADHQYFCGDLNSVSKETLESKGYKHCLESLSKSKPKASKLKWKQAGDFKQDVALMPRNVKFELPEFFSVKLPHRTQETIHLQPSYETGYLFGFFLGDGCANCTVNKSTGSRSGSVSFYVGLDQGKIAVKLSEICNDMFGKRPKSVKQPGGKNLWQLTLYYKPLADFLNSWGKASEKGLPEELLVNHMGYLRGLYDGLFDSDGISSDRLGFSNTSRKLSELFFVLHYILWGIFPTFEHKPASQGGLDSCKLEGCHDAFLSRINHLAEKRLIEDFQVNKILDITQCNEVVPVYDIEVLDSSHSFIADNAIVHNSMCTTRLQTGCGVPQLTAIHDVRNSIDKVWSQQRGNPWRPRVIADGGIRTAGDIVKALACGADAVMIGRLLAGVKETPVPGQRVIWSDGKMKKYRGMASRDFQEEWKGEAHHVEGESVDVLARGTVRDVITSLMEGVMSGMSYQGADSLEDLYENAEFILQSANGYRESTPHGLK